MIRIPFFSKKSKKFLGIDIGTSTIRMVELGQGKERQTLDNYGEVNISSPEKSFLTVRKEVLSLSNSEVAEIIRSICQETGIETEDVNFSIPDFCSFFTNFRLPTMSKEELPEAVRYETRPYIPFPLSEMTLDWSIIEGQVSKTPLRILVVAIPNEIINQYRQIAQLSGLRLRVLEPEVFALAKSSGKNEKKIISLIDIGARSTTCSILEKGILKISHSFNIAGNELTEILARSLNVGYPEAEKLKKKYGLASVKNQTARENYNIRKILIPLIDSILVEIKKIFRDFYQAEGKRVEKIVLAGGGALLPGLKEYFSFELKKEVVISSPFLELSYPPILDKTLKRMGPSYAVVVGLALKGLE